MHSCHYMTMAIYPRNGKKPKKKRAQARNKII